MATDNTQVNPGANGDIVRDLARQAGAVKTQVVQLDLGGVTGNAEVLITAGQQVMAVSVPVVLASNQTGVPTKSFDQAGVGIDSLTMGAGMNGLMTANGATNFFFSTLNTSTTQISGGATYIGTIEPIVSTQNISVILTSDQPGILTINQYIDAAGTRAAQPLVYIVTPGIGFSRSVPANGNYVQVSFKNTGFAATTTLNINTAFGTLPATSNLGNSPVSINEVNGAPINIGASKIASSIPVNLAWDQVVNIASSDTAQILDSLTSY